MARLTRKFGKVSPNSSDHRKVAELRGVKPHEFFGVVAGATGDVKCVVCNTSLSDSLSVERMIGPKCYGDNYKEEPPLSPERFASILGRIVALDSRHCDVPGSIDSDVIEYIVANRRSSRSVANILLAWGSVNALRGRAAKVLAITPIFREMGYARLADRLEKDRSPWHLDQEGDLIYIKTPSPRGKELRTQLSWVGVQATWSQVKGRKYYLEVPAKEKKALWAVLKSKHSNVHLSVSGVGVLVIPSITEPEREYLNSRDVRPTPQPTPAPNLFVRVVDQGEFVQVFTTPPWEAPQAASFVEALRGFKGRRWDQTRKCWSVPKAFQGAIRKNARTLMGVRVQ